MPENPLPTHALLEQGRLAYQSLRFQEALDAYQQILQDLPEDYQAWLGMARTLTRMRRQEEALAAAKRCVEIDSQRPEGHASLGILHFLIDDLDQADQDLARAIELAPDDPDAHLTRAQLLADQRQFSEADEALAKARVLIDRIDEAPSRDELLALAWHVETYVRIAQGDSMAASRAAQEVIALQEANPYAACLAYSNLGILEAKARRYDSAVEYLEKAYALNPYFYRAGAALGRLQLVRRQYRRAAQVLGDVIDKSPDSASGDTRYAYALSLARSGERQAALQAYRIALDSGLSGLNRLQARWQTVWLHEYGRHIVIGLGLVALIAWIVIGKPTPQTMTLLLVLAAILALQTILGRRMR